MARKEVYCETCGSNQPMVEHEPQKDELNPNPWYDITCGACYSIIATVQIVPDDKPLEPSKAIEQPKPQLVKKPRCTKVKFRDWCSRPLPCPQLLAIVPYVARESELWKSRSQITDKLVMLENSGREGFK